MAKSSNGKGPPSHHPSSLINNHVFDDDYDGSIVDPLSSKTTKRKRADSVDTLSLVKNRNDEALSEDDTKCRQHSIQECTANNNFDHNRENVCNDQSLRDPLPDPPTSVLQRGCNSNSSTTPHRFPLATSAATSPLPQSPPHHHRHPRSRSGASGQDSNLGTTGTTSAAASSRHGATTGNNEESDDEDYDMETSFHFDWPNNQSQMKALMKAREECSGIAEHLDQTGQLYIPSQGDGLIREKNVPKLGDTTHPQIYAATDGPSSGKLGMTGNGRVRDGWYDSKGDTSTLVSIFNLEKQSMQQHEKTIEMLDKILENSHNIPLDRFSALTLKDAMDLEKNSLPFCVQLLNLSVTATAGQCSKLCGYGTIKGVKKKVLLSALEVGITEYFEKKDIFPVNRTFQPDESIRGGSLQWVLHSLEECRQELSRLRAKLAAVPRYDPQVKGDIHVGEVEEDDDDCTTYLEFLCRMKHVVKALATWATGLEDHKIPLTPMIMDWMVGEGNWNDAFGDETPPPDDPYNAGLYDTGARVRAQGRIDDELEPHESEFGILIVNENKEAYKDSDLDIHQVLHNRGWRFFHSCQALKVDVYLYYRNDGSWPSKAYVHGSACWMAPSQVELNIYSHTIRSMQARAKDMHFLSVIAELLMKENVEAFEMDMDLSKHSIFGNILFAHNMYIHLVKDDHIIRMAACLMFKNFLLPLDVNCFDKKYHGQSLNGNYNVLSRRLRDKLFLRSGSDCHDWDYATEATNLLSHIRSPNDVHDNRWTEAALDRLGYNAALDMAKDESNRDKDKVNSLLQNFDSFLRSGILTGELHELFSAKRAEVENVWNTRRENRQRQWMDDYTQRIVAGKEAAQNEDHSEMNAILEEAKDEMEKFLEGT